MIEPSEQRMPAQRWRNRNMGRNYRSLLFYVATFAFLLLATWSSPAKPAIAISSGDIPDAAKPTPSSTATKAKNGLQTSDVFTDSGAVLPYDYYNEIDWGDDNNDGKLDLLVSGCEYCGEPPHGPFVYRNKGDGSFSRASTNLPRYITRAAYWGDYDNDGKLDIQAEVCAPQSICSRDYTAIFDNTGSGRYVDSGAQAPRGVWGWDDIDNDGLLDIPVGYTILHNQGNASFTETGAELLPAGDWRSMLDESRADCDNDGRTDVLFTGETDAPTTWLFHNDGHYHFTQISSGLAGTTYYAGAWGDYDNDGLLDLLIDADFDDERGWSTRLYRNTGHCTFVDSGAFSSVGGSYMLAWGDYDNDGLLDAASNKRIFHNDGDGHFTALDLELSGYRAIWGDYDNDSRLDLLVSGSATATKLYHNNSPATNLPPAAPTNLTSQIVPDGNAVTLAWSAPSDDHTPSAGLSYNLRVGTTPGGQDVFSTMADPVSGQRRIPARGPVQPLNYTLEGLRPNQTYYWSVQAIDTAFAGGPFAAEGTFTNPCVFSFTDVHEADYFYQGTRNLFCRRAISGYGDGAFRPYQNTTRAQLVKIVVLSAGWQLLDPASLPFSDVPPNNPFYRYIATAYNHNLISGYGDGTFQPYNSVTRGQAAKIVAQSAGWDLLDPPTPHFADVPTDNPFYRYVETAYAHGVISGYADGSFKWQDNIIRAQIAKMVYLAAIWP